MKQIKWKMESTDFVEGYLVFFFSFLVLFNGGILMEFNGLNDNEVLENRKKYGRNVISKRKKDTFLSLFIETLGDPIIKILLIALAIKVIFLFRDFDWYETIGIVLAIFVASFISSISEYGSSKAFQRLEEETSKLRCLVLRNGMEMNICSDDIVYGDIVRLNTGDRVPADGVLIRGSVSVNEVYITGEAKDKRKVSTSGKNFDDNNFLYMASTIIEGSGYMRVVSVGDNSFYGKIASEVQVESEASPLKIRLGKLAKDISLIGYIAAGLGAFSYLFNVVVINNNFDIDLIRATLGNFSLMFEYLLHSLTLCVTIIVVCVPEGLPMMITLVLSSNMKRMLRDNVLVRKLVGIETAGSLNILFTDKTGTITKGNLEVIGYTLGSGNSYCLLNEVNGKYGDILLKSLVYNNDSIYNNEEKRAFGSNTTDRAIREFVRVNRGSDIRVIREECFDSKKKYSAITIDEGGKHIRYVKGAGEVILDGCTRFYDETGNVQVLDRRKMGHLLDVYTSKGIRVLALATMDGDRTTNYLKNMVFVGFVLIKDDIRESSKRAILEVQGAGIDVVMITGDNKRTADAIAREAGIIRDSSDLVIDSNELGIMSDEEIGERLSHIRVIARALPSDKSRRVDIAKKRGLVVGMTGDGVNDAPALKKSDVGFSMGSGTEVSKEASDIVILDDNIGSIAKAILYGRTIFKSIRKFIICQLTINLSALSVSIIGPFIGVPVPVTVVQMLWINMVMDTLGGLAFSYEAPSDEFMRERPKSKSEGIINGYMFNQILVLGLYSSIICIFFLKSKFINSFFRDSAGNEYLLTAFFGLFIFISLFTSFTARTHRLNFFAGIFKNRVFIGVILFIAVTQIYLIYYGGSLFRTSGLTAREFMVMFLVAFTVIPIDFMRKVITKAVGGKVGV